MRGIAGNDDRPAQCQCGGDRIFGKRFQGFFHPLIEVDLHPLELPVAIFLRNETTRILLQLLQKNPVLGDLGLRLPVCGA